MYLPHTPLLASKPVPVFRFDDTEFVRTGLNAAIALNRADIQPRGGYLAVFSVACKHMTMACLIGEAPKPEDSQRIIDAALRRGQWMLRQPDLAVYRGGRDLQSSPAWGVAIRTEYYILSLAGVPYHVAEAALVCAASNLGWLTRQRACKIISECDNPVGRQLLGHVSQQ